ncbi:helix-turn-helix transcriptional regulator [Mycolicibacterium baixiangningiae]|uniref:helix-turn-helix transcriptional regulator n=1 Tax=Mycolicibacterium baixiangningiae TaxID=2761578 RepID=UPI0018671A22|nr:helix-turn-helix transcriptional regulator [Mycolicibacterium baixiangningiae]
MVTLDEFSRLVSAIYDAAVTPEQWVDAMDAVRGMLGATTAAMITADGSSRLAKYASIVPEAQSSYNAYYRSIDYVLEAVERSPVGTIRDGQSLIAIDARSEFNLDWIRRFDVQDGVFVRLSDAPSLTSFLVAAPLLDEPFAGPDRVELVRALVPHLQQTLRTEKHLDDLRRDAADLAGAIDSMRQAVLVLCANNVVLHCNSAASDLLHRADGLTVRSGRLRAARSDVDGALQRAVAAALGMDVGGARSGASVLCPRPSGGRTYVVHTFPFPAGADHDGEDPRALLVIVDPDDRPQPPKDMLRNLFGLTNGESDVALRVTSGQGLAPISEELSVSVATVKTHLQHVFDKTDTHRQAELVRLLTALLP